MPNLEELIYRRLSQDSELTDMLARFKSSPAIFEMQAPSDTDKGWDSKLQYPRVVYSTDKQENPERKVSGTLIIDVVTMSTQQTGPDIIEERIRILLSNTFFEPDREPTIAFVWNQTSAFQEESEDEMIIGVTITFDMLAFPIQITEEPDPVAGLIGWTTSKYPEAKLFNTVPVEPYVWAPSATQPAIYWRLAGLRIDAQTNSVIWIDATIACHILAPTPNDRLVWIRRITEQTVIANRVRLGDGSPLIIQNISVDSNRDPLREGQITVTARYGVLIPEETGELLNNTHISGAI